MQPRLRAQLRGVDAVYCWSPLRSVRARGVWRACLRAGLAASPSRTSRSKENRVALLRKAAVI